MKPRKKECKRDIDAHNKIKKAFSTDNLLTLNSTLLGISNLLGEFIIKNTPIELMTADVKYALMQTYQWMMAYKEILQSEDGEIAAEMRYMPTSSKDAWKTSEDFEKRLLVLIKALYAELKKQGKIKE